MIIAVTMENATMNWANASAIMVGMLKQIVQVNPVMTHWPNIKIDQKCKTHLQMDVCCKHVKQKCRQFIKRKRPFTLGSGGSQPELLAVELSVIYQ